MPNVSAATVESGVSAFDAGGSASQFVSRSRSATVAVSEGLVCTTFDLPGGTTDQLVDLGNLTGISLLWIASDQDITVQLDNASTGTVLDVLAGHALPLMFSTPKSLVYLSRAAGDAASIDVVIGR